MKIKLNALRFLFLLSIYACLSKLLVSCAKQDSKDVNQDKIWTEYQLFYDKNDDKTKALARFRFGGATGTLLELTDSTGASITFNGQAMPYNTLWSAHYLEFAGNVTSGTFKYTNTNGTSYSNTVPGGADTIAYPIAFDTIKKSIAETFTWGGSALAANQSVSIFVGSWTWAQDALFYTEADGATNLIMGVQSKSGLSTGPAIIYMDRAMRSSTINGTSQGGTISYIYRPKNDTVQVVP
jgi:hypothetical protein